jgi:hypothetical protein
MKQTTKRFVDGRTVHIPYKKEVYALECKNKTEAKFVANLPSLRYHSTKGIFVARDPQGCDTTVDAVIANFRAGTYS